MDLRHVIEKVTDCCGERHERKKQHCYDRVVADGAVVVAAADAVGDGAAAVVVGCSSKDWKVTVSNPKDPSQNPSQQAMNCPRKIFA